MRLLTLASGVVVSSACVALLWVTIAAAEPVVLCKSNTGESPCPVASSQPRGLKAEAASASFTLGELAFSCKPSSLEVNATEGEVGEELVALSFSGCGEGCEVKALNLPYVAELGLVGSGNGEMSLGNGGAGEPRFAVTCGAAVCAYGSSLLGLPVTGGEPASLKAKFSLAKKEGNTALCPTTLGVEAGYQISTPTPAWVEYQRADRTVLCDVAEERCPEEGEHIYPEPTLVASLLPETETVFKLNAVTDRCLASSLELPVAPLGEQYARQISLSGMEFGSCSGSLGPCTVKALGLPYPGSLEPSGGGDGSLQLEGAEGRLIELFCGGISKCRYSPAVDLVGGLEGGSPAHLHVNVSLKRYSGSCPETAHWTADYELTSPSGSLFTELVYP